jgi:hypothetical protein
MGGRRSQRQGPSSTLGFSYHWRHKSQMSLRGPPCAFGASGIPFGEVRDIDNVGQKVKHEMFCSLSDTKGHNLMVSGRWDSSSSPLGVSGLHFCEPNNSALSRWGLRVHDSFLQSMWRIIVVHLSIMDAQNTMGTRRIPE